MRWFPHGRLVGLLALALVSSCAEPSRAPAAAPGDEDVGLPPPDAALRPPIDCKTSTGAQDSDGDGFSRARRDCDDCDPKRGPGALDVPSNDVDEDCDGADATSVPLSCDGELDPTDFAAEAAAHAIGICDQHSESSRLPGLISAKYTRFSDEVGLGDTRQVWLPEVFGTIEPHEGQRLLVLSTGIARDLADPGYTRDCDILGSTRLPDGRWSGGHKPPDGYPMDSSKCTSGVSPSDAQAFNEVQLELTLRSPSNATSFSFDSLFLTYEYPDFVCSPFNDFFIVQVDPPPPGLASTKDNNVLFDESDDTVGVNTSLLRVCREAERGRVARPTPCELGPGLLARTGFDQNEAICAAKQTAKRDIGGASTGWLHTVVPLASPGKTFTIRFVLWDSGDPLLDSTVLVDNFTWSFDAPRRPGTSPIAN